MRFIVTCNGTFKTPAGSFAHGALVEMSEAEFRSLPPGVVIPAPAPVVPVVAPVVPAPFVAAPVAPRPVVPTTSPAPRKAKDSKP